MGSKYIRICIRQKLSTRIYLYLYSPKSVDPNTFVFVFGPENCICHTLSGYTGSVKKEDKKFGKFYSNIEREKMPFLLYWLKLSSCACKVVVPLYFSRSNSFAF